jgi:hypothetical protein
MFDVIIHEAKLPGGYTATFRWDVKNPGMQVEWEPGVPCIKSRRLHRKFLDAYQAERRGFLAQVATSIGGRVAVADTDGNVEIIGPYTVQ